MGANAMHVVGTAGHVDHGKSTLVRALTGIDPDRLKEEQEREMTIDLGFAWLTLPDGESVSIVDVPGHEDFIRNMLAGIGSIDAALLVVASDEGVMPQTREHLAILDLLQIKQGIVALTKADLIQDQEWFELVKTDLAQLLSGTCLSRAKMIPVSARTRQGLPDLLNELSRLLRETPPRRDMGRPRLPIDRVFSVPGFGTVVTGTLIDGRLRVGDEVEIVPEGLGARVRGLQSHKQKIETALPGSRVAVNLAGISMDQLRRGQVVAQPGQLKPTVMVDARVDLLANAGALHHNMELEFFSGSARIPVRARVLGASDIAPGHSGWVQLCFAEPAALLKGDRFIIRRLSPGETVGGGSVVEPHPARRHPRFRRQVLDQLELLANGSPQEILLEALQRDEPADAKVVLQRSNLSVAAAEQALDQLLSEGTVMVLGGDGTGAGAHALLASSKRVISTVGWRNLLNRVVDAVGEYHRQHPLRPGMPREELKSRLGLNPSLFDDLMGHASRSGCLVEAEAVLRLPSHAVKFSPEQQVQVDRLLATFHRNRFTPPTIGEAEAAVGPEVFAALVEQGKMVSKVTAHIQAKGPLSVADVRDMFGTSRKYILPFLEHLDAKKITKRVGDDRVLR
jgi:selenocysteine-specific elongation factor